MGTKRWIAESIYSMNTAVLCCRNRCSNKRLTLFNTATSALCCVEPEHRWVSERRVAYKHRHFAVNISGENTVRFRKPSGHFLLAEDREILLALAALVCRAGAALTNA